MFNGNSIIFDVFCNFFLDTFQLIDPTGQPVPLTIDGVIWEIDKDVRFKNPPIQPGQDLCEAFRVSFWLFFWRLVLQDLEIFRCIFAVFTLYISNFMRCKFAIFILHNSNFICCERLFLYVTHLFFIHYIYPFFIPHKFQILCYEIRFSYFTNFNFEIFLYCKHQFTFHNLSNFRVLSGRQTGKKTPANWTLYIRTTTVFRMRTLLFGCEPLRCLRSANFTEFWIEMHQIRYIKEDYLQDVIDWASRIVSLVEF
jgi:hypothetical protein